MKAKLSVISLFFIVLTEQTNFAQTLPMKIKSYLNKNYQGWKLSPTIKDCAAGFTNNGVVSGDFNGDGKTDFAIKFTKARKGYIFAFVKVRNSFKAFVLHNYDAKEAEYSSLGVWKKATLLNITIKVSV